MPLQSSLLQPTGARFRIALAQMNSPMGDLPGNTERIIGRINEAKEKGASLVAFPELALTGYPPEDLLLKPGFLRDNLDALQTLAKAATGIVAVVGFVDVREDIYNAAAVLTDGKVAGIYHKTFLPNYGVFDEDRYFMRGSSPLVFRLKDLTFGVTVCEDIWYTQGPAHAMATLGGAHLIVNINASPYYRGKWEFREKMLATRAADDGFHLAYVNMIGGQDELVFDGGSVVFSPRGELLARAAHFEEELLLCDLDLMEVMHARLADPRLRKGRVALNNAGVEMPVTTLPALPERKAAPPPPARIATPPSRCSEVYQALVLGVRDYVDKNGFAGVVIGISGGIDSALVACVAVDALGADRVTLVSMPSTYSSGETQSDAEKVARNLGTHFHEIPIKDLQTTWSKTLVPVFAGTESGVAEENLQARSRGNILMAISNKFGAMVLTTGNKSEMACGYATLYGDMAGGFAVIKDVPKTLVFELCEWRNALTPDNPPIPPSIITRPPTAELRPNQKDTDSLPPYEVLDPIIEAYVEEDRSLEELVALGFDEAICRRVILMIDRNEYKRRQAAPGIKITPKAFGRDRRLPITNRFHDL
jgi:NAD+ synthase (glutamine-hydrolysing)